MFRWKNCTRAEALVHFSREKSNELTDQQDMFYYIHVIQYVQRITHTVHDFLHVNIKLIVA